MNENASPPPLYTQVVAEEGEADGKGYREEERLHLAEILQHQVSHIIVNRSEPTLEEVHQPIIWQFFLPKIV